MLNNVRLGTDSELFATRNGVLTSVIGKLGGTKENPRHLGDGYFIQEDNVAAEFNTPVASTVEQWLQYVNTGIDKTSRELRRLGMEPMIVPYGSFPLEEIETPEALKFGCNEFINAYTFEKSKLEAGMLQDMASRFAAGHVHISWDNPDTEPFMRTNLVRYLDLYLALPLLLDLTDEELVLEKSRRSMYGKAGSCRPKEYGVEYITLSNLWLKDSARIRTIWLAIQDIAIGRIRVPKEATLKYLESDVNYAINECSKEAAGVIMASIMGRNWKTTYNRYGLAFGEKTTTKNKLSSDDVARAAEMVRNAAFADARPAVLARRNIDWDTIPDPFNDAGEDQENG